MKDTHFLYSIATLAIGSLLAIFVSFATGTLPKSPLREVRVSPTTLATAPAPKNCECCGKVTAEELKASRESLAAVRKQRLAYQKASQLIQQYGIEEGLRRLKASHPEVAEQLEHFTEKYRVAAEH